MRDTKWFISKQGPISIFRFNKMWLHVDACWGGSVVFSKKLKHLMAGSEKVDSIAWNPHKMVGAPLQTSAFIVRHKGILHTTNSANATYLFQQVKKDLFWYNSS